VVLSAIGLDILLSACTGPGPGVLRPETPQRLMVTITENGVDPPTAKRPICRSSWGVVYVTFVNREGVAHDIRSDPHPSHTAGQNLNHSIGTLASSDSKEVSMLGCTKPERFVGYHDKTRPDDERFWGRIEER
jgi:hypothetical protein